MGPARVHVEAARADIRAARPALLGSLVVATIAAVAAAVASAEVAGYLDLVQWTAACTGAFLLALIRWRHRPPGGAHPSDQLPFVLAAGALLAGQLVWNVQALAGWTLLPSPADWLYLLAGPALAVGVARVGRRGLDRRAWRIVVADTAALAFGSVTACLAAILPARGDASMLQVLVLSAYSSLLTVPAALAIVLMLTKRAAPGLATLLLPTGSMLLAVAWMLWNLDFLHHTVGNGSWLSALFSVGFLTVGLGILLFDFPPLDSRRWERFSEGTLRLLPMFMTVAATAGASLVYLSQRGDVANAVAIIGGAVVLAVAMLRQSLLLEEYERLVRAERLLLERELELERRVHHRTQELGLATERAQAANTAKGEFLANMSHEVRTPLNSVLGLSYLTLQDADLPPKARHYVERIHSSGSHLLRLIDDVLQMSRIEAGRLELERLPVDLAAVFDAVRAHLDFVAADKGLKLAFQLHPGARQRFMGDAFRLQQVLLNLVSNGLKFTERGEVRVQAWVREEDDLRAVVKVQVTDTGIGIGPEALPFIFKPFRQADSSTTRRYGGTGLGLAITKQLLETMGGALTVSSRLGEGTTFQFVLPLEKAWGDPAPSPSALPGAMPRPGLRILLVEDDETNRLVATAMLERWQAEVTVAEDGAEAMRRLAQDGFDCVLLDVQMPRIDGLDVARWVRQQPHLDRLPLIAMTANVLEEDRRACLESGMNDFVSKPIDPDLLGQALQRWGGSHTAAD